MTALNMKMFRASGGDEERQLEGRVNAWLAAAQTQGIKVVKTETTMCSIGDREEIYPHVLITLWYSRPWAPKGPE